MHETIGHAELAATSHLNIPRPQGPLQLAGCDGVDRMSPLDLICRGFADAQVLDFTLFHQLLHMQCLAYGHTTLAMGWTLSKLDSFMLYIRCIGLLQQLLHTSSCVLCLQIYIAHGWLPDTDIWSLVRGTLLIQMVS